MRVLKMQLPNFNNKMAADRFIHIFTREGNYTLHEYLHEIQFEFKDHPGRWKVFDVGSDQADMLPRWIYQMSHNCVKQEFINASGIKPDSTVFFFLFEKIQP